MLRTSRQVQKYISVRKSPKAYSAAFCLKMSTVQSFSSQGELKIAASVATGLETVAAAEVREMLGYSIDSGKVRTAQGRVYMETSKEHLAQIHKLRSVDRLFLVVKTYGNYMYKDSKEDVYSDLRNIARSLPWTEVIAVWNLNKPYCKEKSRQENLSKKMRFSINDSQSPSSKPQEVYKEQMNAVNSSNRSTQKQYDSESVPTTAFDGTLIRFRVTTNRVGKKQPVTSPEASYCFGGEIQDITGWKVDLSGYNLEIMLCLGENSLEVAVALTLQSLHRRNITHFGVTTLRATTSYCMLRMCSIVPGDIVIDPMCGSGAIPVEGALEWPTAFHIGGDQVNAAVTRCISNMQFINDNPHFSCKKRTSLCADVIRWDVKNLPIKSDYVDVIVSDLPFGKRMGSKVDNRKLYPALLNELARVTKCGTGRACLLTQDKRTIVRALNSLSSFWKVKKTLYINIGGLTAGVFLIHRTDNPFETSECVNAVCNEVHD